MISHKTSQCGGAAAQSLTFLPYEECRAQTPHLRSPTSITVNFQLKSPTDKPSSDLGDYIRLKFSMMSLDIKTEKRENTLMLTLSFEKHEDLKKSKGSLQSLEFMFTDKGKSSKRKPQILVVQPRKGERTEDPELGLEPFPVAVLGKDFHMELRGLMNQDEHKFLNNDIVMMIHRLNQSQLLDERWAQIIKLPVYHSGHPGLKIGGSSQCVPHPNNPMAQAEIFNMQKSSPNKTDFNFNWFYTGYISVPKEILAIKVYWQDNRFGVSELPTDSDMMSLCAPIVSTFKFWLPRFNIIDFLIGLSQLEPISPVPGPGFESFFLRTHVISMLFKFDKHGRFEENPNRERYAQMIPVSAFERNHRVVPDHKTSCMLPGYKTQLELRDILIVCPGKSFKLPVGKVFGSERRLDLYYSSVKVLIPHEFLLNMPEVWEQFERRDYIVSGDR